MTYPITFTESASSADSVNLENSKSTGLLLPAQHLDGVGFEGEGDAAVLTMPFSFYFVPLMNRR